jgi:hypothetical protein
MRRAEDGGAGAAGVAGSTAMTDSSPPPTAAGGVLVALGSILGAAAGFAVGEATAGFLIGLGLGAVAALLIWWRDRA